MEKFKVIFISILAVSMFAVSCKEKEADSSNPKLVNNPATGDNIPANAETLPAMTFEHDTYDFGEIIQDEVVTHNFQFTNTGKSDLVITSARASCGCTVPEYPKEPVKPGDKGVIKVTFNSENKKDTFNKTVTITANTYPNENKLHIKGIIIVPSDK